MPLGTAAKIRKTNRRSFDYKHGYVSLSTPVPISKYTDPNKANEHLALFPGERFVETFEDSAQLKEILESKADELMQDWDTMNGDARSAGRKTNVERVFTLMENRWTNFRRVEEHAEYQLQLNTYK
jgi:hypothetical protein